MGEAFRLPSAAQIMMAEFLLAAWPTPESHRYLKSVGLSERMPEVEANCSLLTVALVNYFDGPSGTLFRFAADGVPSVIIGAHPAAGESPHDLVAWKLYGNDSSSFATYRQEADLLGIPAALRSRNMRSALHLYPTPEDWLLSGFDGTVVLNRKWGGYWLNRLPGPFICADIEHGHEIASMLRPYAKSHLVQVPNPALGQLRMAA